MTIYTSSLNIKKLIKVFLLVFLKVIFENFNFLKGFSKKEKNSVKTIVSLY